MAANNFEEITPKLLAQGLMALRTTCVMPRLVNRDYDELAMQKGSTIDVPIPSAVKVADVFPDANSPTTETLSPTTVPIKLNKWKEAAFYLTDKEMKETMMGTIPMQASEAISGLADEVDSFILSHYKDVNSLIGTPGVTPLSGKPVKFVNGVATEAAILGTTRDVNQASKALSLMKAPKMNRRFVIDPEMEASALDLRAFQDVSFNGSNFGIVEGEINRKLGFDWFMDQNIPTHVTGFKGAATIKTAAAVGGKEVALTVVNAGAVVAAKPIHGDVFVITGDKTQYVVMEAAGGSANAPTLKIEPALVKAIAEDAVVTFYADHVVNLAFHRDAIAFATRPLEDEGNGLGNVIMSQVDPVSGLALRLEISREHKRIRFSFDILYGAGLVRRNLITRVAG